MKRLRRGPVAPAVAGLVLALLPSTGNSIAACDWPMYGHDLGHSFAAGPGCTTISPLNVSTLRPRWFFNAHAPVTASPTVVGNTVYVGAFDGRFYALDAATGTPRWSFLVTDKNTNSYGPIVSSAAVDIVDGTTVVAFGGGSTLYLLDAATGHELASSCFDPRPDPAVQCQGSDEIIESETSPAIVHLPDNETRIVAGMDFNEDPTVGRAGVIELRVDHDGSSWGLTPLWKFDPETLQTYTVDPLHAGGKGSGCGNVWSSPAVDLAANLVFFGVGNCDLVPSPVEPGDGEAIVAISLLDGTLQWRYAPRTAQEGQPLDLDFGSSAQLLPDGRVGEAGKDGTYYALKRSPGTATPQPDWKTHVAVASDIGGFIASTALGVAKGQPAIFGPSAIPISTRDPRGSFKEIAADPRRAFSLHAINARTGAVVWDAPMPLPSYGAVTYANGVVFFPATFGFQLQAYHADLGVPLWLFPIPAPSSAAAVVGSAIYVGSGTAGGGLPLDTLGGVWSFGLAAG